MKSIYGQKIGMTRIFTEQGESVGVTVIKVDQATVVRTKTVEKDGYSAAVLGFGDVREKLLTKPAKGQFAKAGVDPRRHLLEVHVDEDDLPEAGNTFGVDIFKPGEKVHVSGISRGHGFQGGVKRHKFGGGPKTHGQSDRYRAPGSIGQSSSPSRVFKGTRMAGHMGNQRVTVKNLKVVDVQPDQSLLLVKGVVPGHKNALLLIRKAV